MNLKIEYLPIDEIKPYAGNAKLHPAEQIEQIKKSIQEFGFNDPIAVCNGEIVEGHGRYIAAQELGIDRLPIIRLDHLSDEQRRAYALVHNKLTMNSDFDFDLLQLELESLDLDMEDFGFDFSSLDDIIEQEEEPEQEQGAISDHNDDNDPYIPDKYDDDEISVYTNNSENYLIKQRVIITYLPEQEEEMKEILGVVGDIKIVYDFDELNLIRKG